MSDKVTIHEVYAQNFRSIGSPGMILNLEESSDTLVVSEDNGQGKSTMLVHAPFYCLFDKAYGEGDKKTSLINSQNRKDTLVRLTLSAKGKRYEVTRGMKPTIFDIKVWGDDGKYHAIDQEAGLGDHQDILDEITGLDATAFCNSIALGVDKFKPFVNMKTAERRPFVERILGLEVFTKMADRAKDRLKVIKSELSDAEYSIKTKESSLASKQENLDLRESNAAELLEQAEKQVDQCNAELVPINKSIDESLKKLGMIDAKVSGIATNQMVEVDQLTDDHNRGTESQSASQLTDRNAMTARHSEELDPVKDRINSELAVFDKNRDIEVNKAKMNAKHAVDLAGVAFDDEIARLDDALKKAESAEAEVREGLAPISKELEELHSAIASNGIQVDQNQKIVDGLQQGIDKCYAQGACPSCSQDIPDSLKASSTESARKELDEYKAKIAEYELASQDASDQISGVQKKLDDHRKKVNESADLTTTARSLRDARKSDRSDARDDARSSAMAHLTSLVESKAAERQTLVTNQTNEINAIQTRIDAELNELTTDQLQANNTLKTEQTAEINALNDTHRQSNQKFVDMNTKITSIYEADKKIKSGIDARLATAESSLDDLRQKASFDFEGARAEIDELELQIAVENAEFEKKEEIQRSLVALTTSILTDKGLKASILDKYLPFINQKVNSYLNSMGIYLNLDMDNAYNITMNAPNRRGQTVYSLSNGQKGRLNCAFMLAWRDVADMRSSTSCNLLVLDETLENISETGVKEAIDLVKSASKGKNLFVVSQRNSEFEEHFASLIKYSLREEYSIRVQ